MKNRMKGGKILSTVFAGVLLAWIGGCDHISEPWVRRPDQLQQERARPSQARLALKNRLLAIQTDR